jgi:hypothetical protein
MTARIQGGQSGDAIVGVIHAFRNASEPLSDGVARKGQAVFWKIATQDDVDAKSFTFTVSRPPRQKKKQSFG